MINVVLIVYFHKDKYSYPVVADNMILIIPDFYSNSKFTTLALFLIYHRWSEDCEKAFSADKQRNNEGEVSPPSI